MIFGGGALFEIRKRCIASAVGGTTLTGAAAGPARAAASRLMAAARFEFSIRDRSGRQTSTTVPLGFLSATACAVAGIGTSTAASTTPQSALDLNDGGRRRSVGCKAPIHTEDGGLRLVFRVVFISPIPQSGHVNFGKSTIPSRLTGSRNMNSARPIAAAIGSWQKVEQIGRVPGPVPKGSYGAAS